MKRQKRIKIAENAYATVDHDCPKETIHLLKKMVELVGKLSPDEIKGLEQTYKNTKKQ